MSEKITIRDFSAGWIPSDDQFSGRKNGLLKMDGVTLDENGSLVMPGGTKKIAFQYPSPAHTIFTKFMCGERRRYAALENGAVYRNSTEIVSAGSGSTERAAFGTFGNFVMIASGSQKIKDICGTGIGNLGIIAPDESIDITPINTALDDEPVGNFSNFVEGTIFPGSFTVVDNVIALTTGLIAFNDKMESVTNTSANDFEKDLSGADSDIFRFTLKIDDISKIITYSNANNVIIKFHVSGTDTTYDITIGGQDLKNVLISDTWYVHEITRAQIGRTGPDPYNWQKISGATIVVKSDRDLADAIWSFKDFQFGGADEEIEGELDGTYEWVQVNVYRTAGYTAKSEASPVSEAYSINRGYASIVPFDPTIDEPLANEVWFYRRGGNLPDFYRVGTMSMDALGTFDDILSDSDVLALGEILNSTSLSVTDGIEDDILEIVGPVHGRVLYFTEIELFFSDIDSPDTINPARTMTFVGSEAEKFLWARKVTENVVLIGTTADIYVLTGSWITYPDGTIDITIRPLGIDKPPICRDVAVYKSNVVYFSTIGWTLMSLGNDYAALVNPSLRLLYNGEERYAYGGVPVAYDPEYRYSLAVAKDKIYCASPVITDYTSEATIIDPTTWSRRLEIYDFLQKYWRPFNYCPLLLAVEEDGAILGFFDDNRFGIVDYAHSKRLNTV